MKHDDIDFGNCEDKSPEHLKMHDRVDKVLAVADEFRRLVATRAKGAGLHADNLLHGVIGMVTSELVNDPDYMPKLRDINEIKPADRRRILTWLGRSRDGEKYVNLGLQLMGDRPSMGLKIADVVAYGLELYETEVRNVCRDVLVELGVLQNEEPF